MAVEIGIKVIGAAKFAANMKSSKTIGDPLKNNIRTLTLKAEAETKKATVVDTGRLRSSITSRIQGQHGFVGTNVAYAQFIEYGTTKMPARHMEGATKVLGTGMFSYMLQLLKNIIDSAEKALSKDIEKKATSGD